MVPGSSPLFSSNHLLQILKVLGRGIWHLLQRRVPRTGPRAIFRRALLDVLMQALFCVHRTLAARMDDWGVRCRRGVALSPSELQDSHVRALRVRDAQARALPDGSGDRPGPVLPDGWWEAPQGSLPWEVLPGPISSARLLGDAHAHEALTLVSPAKWSGAPKPGGEPLRLLPSGRVVHDTTAEPSLWLHGPPPDARGAALLWRTAARRWLFHSAEPPGSRVGAIRYALASPVDDASARVALRRVAGCGRRRVDEHTGPLARLGLWPLAHPAVLGASSGSGPRLFPRCFRGAVAARMRSYHADAAGVPARRPSVRAAEARPRYCAPGLGL